MMTVLTTELYGRVYTIQCNIKECDLSSEDGRENFINLLWVEFNECMKKMVNQDPEERMLCKLNENISD